ncbi:MAG: LytTR family DNA-binding domain-containing protein [Fibrobacter sp.]|nr:LytTR family DNA-binding domain-containing protein [Fibrobacter sp.]
MSFSVLIVDDEPLARKRMRVLLEEFSSEIEILGEAGSGAAAIQQIRELMPDVVFLDIQMPDMDGFDVLHGLNREEVPLVVFTTAYDNFAVKAFEEDTVDYLLKPVEQERLAAAIEKIRRRMPTPENEPALPQDFDWEKLRELVNRNDAYIQRLQIKIGDRIVFLNLDEVVRFQSEEKYTTVYAIDGRYVIDTPLIELEKKLDPRNFVKVHRSHIVAIDYIAECRKTEQGKMVMVLKDKNNTQLQVSRSVIKKFRNL